MDDFPQKEILEHVSFFIIQVFVLMCFLFFFFFTCFHTVVCVCVFILPEQQLVEVDFLRSLVRGRSSFQSES